LQLDTRKNEELKRLRAENARLHKHIQDLELLIQQLQERLKFEERFSTSSAPSSAVSFPGENRSVPGRPLLLDRSQLELLVLLATVDEPMRIKEIASRLQRTVAGVGNALRRLRHYGLVLHDKPYDRRVYRVRIDLRRAGATGFSAKSHPSWGPSTFCHGDAR